MNPLAEKFEKLGAKMVTCRMMDEENISAAIHYRGISLDIEGDITTRLSMNAYHCSEDDTAFQEMVTGINEIFGEEPLLRASFQPPEYEQYLFSAVRSIFGTSPEATMRPDQIACEILRWDKYIPERFLRRMMNDVRNPIHDIYLRAELSGGRKVEDYVDAKLTQLYQRAQQLHETFMGVFGLDPSYVDFARIEEAKDLELFLAYSTALCELSEIPSKDNLLDVEYIRYRICQSEQIAISEPSSEHCLHCGPEFKKWEDFYFLYIDHMSEEKRLQLIDAYSRGEDLTPYQPKTNWRQYKPCQPRPKPESKAKPKPESTK